MQYAVMLSHEFDSSISCVRGVYTITSFFLLLQAVFTHSTNLELLSVMVANHQASTLSPSPSPAPLLTPFDWAKVLTSSAVVEAVAGELLKTTQNHLDQSEQRPLDQSEQKSLDQLEQRSLDQSEQRSLDQLEQRSLDQSEQRSLDQSEQRSLDQ